MNKDGNAGNMRPAAAYADAPPYDELLGYFDPQVLAAYRTEPDKYRIETDTAHGTVMLTEKYCQELEAANKTDDFIYIPFGYRMHQGEGSRAIVVFLHDLFQKSKGHVQRWSGFRLSNSQWSQNDEGFNIWARRNLAGEWTGGAGVCARRNGARRWRSARHLRHQRTSDHEVRDPAACSRDRRKDAPAES
jgi:hypothetical protein